MDEEENLDLDLQTEPETEARRPDNRFKDLSDKVKATSEERDKASKEAEKAKSEAEAAKKEAEFYKGFNAISSKYEGAAEYQDKILEKVNAGYDMEDAAISILAKEGKYAPQIEVERESPAGGSATTQVVSLDDKPLSEMTTAEKREALLQIEKESGGVSQMLRRGL